MHVNQNIVIDASSDVGYIIRKVAGNSSKKKCCRAVSNVNAKMGQRQLSCMEQNNVTLAHVEEESRWLHTLYIADIHAHAHFVIYVHGYIFFI